MTVDAGTIAIVAVAYVVVLFFAICLLTAAKRGDTALKRAAQQRKEDHRDAA